MADLELFVGNRNYSSWSLRAWLVLRHSGLPFREELIPLGDEGRKRIREVSPAGKVPILRHGDLLVWDSLAIAEYVAELPGAAHLWPEDRAARARARSVCAEMHAGFTALRSHMTMNLRRSAPGLGRGPGVQEDIDRITASWRDCRARAGDAGPFLFGLFTIADAFYAPVVSRFRTYGVALDPVCRAYADTVWELPSMRDARATAAAEPWTIEAYEVKA